MHYYGEKKQKKKKIIEPLRSQTHKLFANNIIDPEMVLGYFFKKYFWVLLYFSISL